MADKQSYCGHYFVRCARCQKVLNCSAFDDDCLLQHFKEAHPDVQVSKAEDNLYDYRDETKINRKNQQKDKVNPKSAKESNKCIKSKEKSASLKSIKFNKTDNDSVGDSRRCEEQYRIVPYICCTKRQKSDASVPPSRGESLCAPERLSTPTPMPTQTSTPLSFSTDSARSSRRDIACLKSRTSQSAGDSKESHCSQERSRRSGSQSSTKYSGSSGKTQILYCRKLQQKESQSDKTGDIQPSDSVKFASKPLLSPCALYESSMRRYIHGKSCIFCPNCCCANKPVIKSREEVMSQNSPYSKCLFSCCPRCLVTIFIPEDKFEYLYCCTCKSFFGVYNPLNNCVRPNRQFLSRNERFLFARNE